MLGQSDNSHAWASLVSNAPRPDGELVLQVALMEGGATSAWVHDTLMPGEGIKLSGPYGTFIGDPAVDSPILCLAAGTGLAPILALTEAAMRRGFRQPVMLLVAARTHEDVYGLGLLAWWRARHRKFDYRVTLTREERDGCLAGRVGDVLPAVAADLSRHAVFAAGSPGFVTASVRRPCAWARSRKRYTRKGSMPSSGRRSSMTSICCWGQAASDSNGPRSRAGRASARCAEG